MPSGMNERYFHPPPARTRKAHFSVAENFPCSRCHIWGGLFKAHLRVTHLLQGNTALKGPYNSP